MPFEAQILNTQPLPTVRLVASGLTAGPYTITATYEGGSHTAASGVVINGESVVVADARAPLGRPVSYELTSGPTVLQAGPVTRSYDGRDVLTGASGKSPVEVLRQRGDSRSYTPREYVAEVPGRAVGPARYGPTAGAPTGAMTVRTDADNSSRLHGLVMANRPVIYLHNRCQLPDCDVSPSQLIFLIDVNNELAGNMHFAERIWNLGYRPADNKSPHQESPVATFDELTATYNTFTALLNDNTAFDVVRSGEFLL